LEIGTRKENAADMRRDGTVKSVINLDMAKQIKSLKDTKPPSAIAKELGVSVHIVRDIWKGKSWQYA
jgi:DNA invertase Pin-like site-specific DNA recombinase